MVSDAIKKIVEGKNLSREEARAALDVIMDGKASPAQIAAFLVGLRMKGETVDEITGCVESMRAHSVKISPNVPVMVDTCGTGGDGAHTFNVSTVAAFVVAGAGVPVAKHGNRAISSKCGSADLLEALGVNIEVSPEVTKRSIEEIGIGFMFAPLYHPAMKHAGPIRKELGIRTVFNILGPMTNPAGVKRQVIGVFKKELAPVMAEVLKNLGSEHAWIVHGADGLDEISLTGPTHVVELKDGTIREFQIRPEDVGLKPRKMEDLKAKSMEETVATARKILDGTERGPLRDWVVFNAGAAILVGGKASDLPAAVSIATKVLEAGVGLIKLNLIQSFQFQ